MRKLLISTLLLAVALPAAHARQVRTLVAPRGNPAMTSSDDGDRAFLGVATNSTGKRDTLGLLISSVTPGSPAEKAGLEEGNRIASINGVSLKVSREDAGEYDMSSVMTNRLQREMRKVKAGDDVSLDVWAGGRYRSMKVKTVAADDISPMRRVTADDEDNRAVFGISLSSTGSKRDAEGIFISAVTPDGPAEKAGIVEGDRIASINGVDLRVAKDDAGDSWVSSSRVQRLQREIRKLKAGDAADISVWSGGRTRTVKVTSVKASALTGGESIHIRTGDGFENGFSFTPQGGTFVMPRIRVAPGTNQPRVQIYRDGTRSFDDVDAGEIRAQVERMLNRELPLVMGEVGPAISGSLIRELPRAMEELRTKLEAMKDEMPAFLKTRARGIII